jgi:hypothetical protein
MRKVLSVLLVALLVLGLGTTAFANGNGKGNTKEIVLKPIAVSLTQVEDEIEVGTEVNLTATVQKHGQWVSGAWSQGATETQVATLDQETGTYTSNATFVANEEGEHTVTYTARMKAGNSHIMFGATGESVLTYIDSDEVVVVQRVTIKVVRYTTNYSGGRDPQITNHTVTAEVTTELSNGDVDTEEIEFTINRFEKPEDVSYTYTNEEFGIEETVTFEDVPLEVGYEDTVEPTQP